MKVGFPIETDNGMDSKVYGHFGSAPAFLIVDTELDQATTVGGSSEHKEHGACNPVKTLGGNLPDALVTGGIGMGAIMRLGEMGVKIYRAAAPPWGRTWPCSSKTAYRNSPPTTPARDMREAAPISPLRAQPGKP